MRGRATGRAWGGGNASSAQWRDPSCGGCRGRARAERTQNMSAMFMTLEVSKLSGWLNAEARTNMDAMSETLDVSRLSGWSNADARCRVKKEA